MLPTQHQLNVMCEICCEFFIFQQNNMSAHWACTAFVSMSPIKAFWNGRHPRSFHQAHGPSTQIWIQWTTKFAQKCSSRSTCSAPHYGLTGMASTYASPVTQQMRCAFTSKDDFLNPNFIVDFNVLFWRKWKVSCFYCVTYTRILQFF